MTRAVWFRQDHPDGRAESQSWTMTKAVWFPRKPPNERKESQRWMTMMRAVLSHLDGTAQSQSRLLERR